MERPVIIGTSFGGFVAQAYATRHPDHVGGLVLICTAAKMDFAAVFAAFERLAGPEAAAVAEEYWMDPTPERRAKYREVCFPHYTLDPNPPGWAKRVILKDDVALHFNGPKNEHGRMDFRSGLALIHCPVLVMAGEQDPITPPEFSEVIKASLPEATSRLVRFDHAGHGIVTDQRDAFFAEIETFLASLPETN
ncbi:MAG: alpha/beta hydrolase [Pseudomonadota bacterium]